MLLKVPWGRTVNIHYPRKNVAGSLYCSFVFKKLNGRLARGGGDLFLQQFNIKIKRPGAANSNADGLSCRAWITERDRDEDVTTSSKGRCWDHPSNNEHLPDNDEHVFVCAYLPTGSRI